MMSCEDCLDKLHDFLTRELTPEVLTPLQKHLDDCPPCLNRFDFSQKLRGFVQKRGAEDVVPDGLQARILAEVDKARTELEKVVPMRRKALPLSRGQSLFGLVASLAVAVSLAGGLVMARGSAPPAEAAMDSPMLAALAEDHVNCSSCPSMSDEQSNLSMDQVQSQMSDRLGFAVHLPHLPVGCHGLSWRVCHVDGVDVGHVILHRAGHVFSWFVVNTHSLPGDEQLASTDQPRTVSSEAMLLRVHDDQTDCIVSEQPADVQALAVETHF